MKKEKYTAECCVAVWSIIGVGCKDLSVCTSSTDQAKAELGIQCLGRGGSKSQLLDVTEKKGHVGETWVKLVAAGGSWETSLPLLHHSKMFQQ